MNFIALFIFILNYIWGKITKAMIDDVNEEVLKGEGLMSSALDPYLSYIYFDSILSQLGKSYFDKTPLLKNFIDRYFGKDKPENILDAILHTFFSLSRGGTITRDVINSSIIERYFINEISRSKSIKMFSTFFLKLLKKDDAFKFKSNFIDEQNLIIDPELSKILNNDIEVDQNTLVLSLITLNTFMLKVLDTKDELKEYVTNILNNLTDEDKEYIKTSPYYFLKFNKVENNNEITIFNTLYNIPHPKFVFNFYKLREYVVPIPTGKKFKNKNFKDLTFFDSVEFTLLYLCNFLFYDEEKEQFDLEHLKLHEDSDLLKFYTKYKRPFDIFDDDIREDWSKVLENLQGIDIDEEVENDNLDRIYYKNEDTDTDLKSSIHNVIAVLADICSSKNNDVKEKYIELFNRKLEANSVITLLESFFKLLVKKSADLKCENKGIEVINYSINGNINLTAIANDEKESTKQLSFIFTSNYTNFCYNLDENFQFLDDLKKISFEFKDNEKFNALEFIIVSYVDELQKKLFNKLPETDNKRCYIRTSPLRY